MYSSTMFRFSPPFCIADISAETASLTGMTPPDDIDMDIRKAMTESTTPNAQIILNLRFLTAISLSSSGGSMSLRKAL